MVTDADVGLIVAWDTRTGARRCRLDRIDGDRAVVVEDNFPYGMGARHTVLLVRLRRPVGLWEQATQDRITLGADYWKRDRPRDGKDVTP